MFVDKVAEAKQYTVIVDGTQDASRKEQLAMCLRYVDEHLSHTKSVEFYLYPTVGTVLIHSVKPELTE